MCNSYSKRRNTAPTRQQYDDATSHICIICTLVSSLHCAIIGVSGGRGLEIVPNRQQDCRKGDENEGQEQPDPADQAQQAHKLQGSGMAEAQKGSKQAWMSSDRRTGSLCKACSQCTLSLGL